MGKMVTMMMTMFKIQYGDQNHIHNDHEYDMDTMEIAACMGDIIIIFIVMIMINDHRPMDMPMSFSITIINHNDHLQMMMMI